MTLHWFFSLGTARSPARYVLTEAARNRLVRFFPDIREVQTGGVYAVSQKRSATASLLDLCGQPRDGITLNLRLFPTETAAKAPLTDLMEDLPVWAKPLCPSPRACDLLGDRNPETITKIVKAILEEVNDGDAVFIESTGGLRPFSTGLTLAYGLLASLRPKVQLVGAVYGELQGRKGDPAQLPADLADLPDVPGNLPRKSDPTSLSPIYDVSGLLALPQWASAADDLRRRLDGARLAELVRSNALADSLKMLARNLDLGWPDDLVAPLVAVQEEAAKAAVRESEGAPELGAVLGRLNEGLGSLAARARGLQSGTSFEAERIEFHLEVVRLLCTSGRYGDCVRVARELLVGATAARTGTGTDWKSPRARGAAERALFRSRGKVKELWDELGIMRNAASHARSSRNHAVTGEELVSFVTGGGGLAAKITAILPQLPNRAVPSGVVVFCIRGSQVPPEATGEAQVELGDDAPPSQTCREKVKKAAEGYEHAVLWFPDAPGHLCVLAAALVEIGTRPYTIVGGKRVPLFVEADFA